MLTSSTSESEGLARTIFLPTSSEFQVQECYQTMDEMDIFIGCGNNRFLSVKIIMINNSTFQGQNDSGTALSITETNLIITNTFFISNRVGNSLDIVDRNTSLYTFVHVGGAIFVAKSNLTIVKCVF